MLSEQGTKTTYTVKFWVYDQSSVIPVHALRPPVLVLNGYFQVTYTIVLAKVKPTRYRS